MGHTVEILVDADSGGPTEAHTRYWRELIARWPELKAACEPLLRQTLVNWIESPGSGDIWSRLRMESLDVPAGTPPEQWELMFWCEEARHWPTVAMRRWTPTECFVDGFTIQSLVLRATVRKYFTLERETRGSRVFAAGVDAQAALTF